GDQFVMILNPQRPCRGRQIIDNLATKNLYALRSDTRSLFTLRRCIESQCAVGSQGKCSYRFSGILIGMGKTEFDDFPVFILMADPGKEVIRCRWTVIILTYRIISFSFSGIIR